jgi:hypothetical protein
VRTYHLLILLQRSVLLTFGYHNLATSTFPLQSSKVPLYRNRYYDLDSLLSSSCPNRVISHAGYEKAKLESRAMVIQTNISNQPWFQVGGSVDPG